MDKFFKNALLTGTALLGLNALSAKNLEGKAPGDQNKALSGQEVISPTSEQGSMIFADLKDLEVKPNRTQDEEATRLQLREMLGMTPEDSLPAESENTEPHQ